MCDQKFRSLSTKDEVDKILKSTSQNYIKPHKERLSNWYKDILKSSGINMNNYTTHSSKYTQPHRKFGYITVNKIAKKRLSNESTLARNYEKSIEKKKLYVSVRRRNDYIAHP